MVRKLKFIVDGMIIKPDPECDFNNLVPGSEEYLQAEFSFSKDWYNYVKVAAFYSVMGNEFPPKQIKEGVCMIPKEALARREFQIQIVGKKDLTKKKTNSITITQNGGVA